MTHGRVVVIYSSIDNRNLDALSFDASCMSLVNTSPRVNAVVASIGKFASLLGKINRRQLNVGGWPSLLHSRHLLKGIQVESVCLNAQALENFRLVSLQNLDILVGIKLLSQGVNIRSLS